MMKSLCNHLFGLKIEVTSKCNCNCIMCPRTKSLNFNRNKHMDLQLFKKIIDDIQEEHNKIDKEARLNILNSTAKKINKTFPILFNYFSESIIKAMKEGKTVIKLYGYGEPFLNPDIFKMLKYLKDKGFFVAVTTNGSLLNKLIVEKMLTIQAIDELNISMDAHIKNLYEKIRQGLKFDIIIDNLRSLKNKIGEKNYEIPRLNISVVRTKENRDSIKDIIKFFENENLSVSIDEDLYSRPRLKDFFCPWLSHTLFVYSNGDVVKCCLDPEKSSLIGNVADSRLRDIWLTGLNIRYLVLNNLNRLNQIKVCKKYCVN